MVSLSCQRQDELPARSNYKALVSLHKLHNKTSSNLKYIKLLFLFHESGIKKY